MTVRPDMSQSVTTLKSRVCEIQLTIQNRSHELRLEIGYKLVSLRPGLVVCEHDLRAHAQQQQCGGSSCEPYDVRVSEGFRCLLGGWESVLISLISHIM